MSNQIRIGWRANTPSSISYLISSLAAMSNPILSTYTGSSVAHSLRKLKTTYSGYAIKVRRSSDNTETDIGFSGEVLDTVSLLTFVGSGNGFVTTWYDQSGNDKHATQTTASKQPQIVSSGSVIVRNTKPTIKFDGVDDYLFINSAVNVSLKTNFTVTCLDGNSVDYDGIWVYGNITAPVAGIPVSAETNYISLYPGGRKAFSKGLTTGVYFSNQKQNATTYVTWNQGVQLPNVNGTLNLVSLFSPTSITGDKYMVYGGDPYNLLTRSFNGTISECVFFENDLINNVTEINANINSYYSIYTQDTNPLTAAAYSLRKLTADYTGSAIRVRRSGDNTEQNIGFKSDGSLDENTLTTFAESPNSFLYSQDFDNAYWTKNAVTITANQGIAPDGTQTADLLQENVGNAYHYLTQKTINGFNVGDSWNMSFYAKKSPTNTGSNKIMMRQWTNDYSDGGSTAVFNLETGQVVHTTDGTYQGGTFGILGATMSNEGNGWWRCSMYGKRLASTWGSQVTDYSIAIGRVATLTMWSETIVGAPVYTQKWPGDTTASYYIWGVQLTKKNDESYQATKTYTKTTTSYPGSAYVTTWYDQSGNSRNLAQATAINQPPIIELGTIVKVNGKPNLSFLFSSTTRRWLGMTWGTTTINPPFSIFLSMKISQLYDFNILTGLEANKRFGMYIGKYTFWAADNNYMFGDVANTNSSIHYIYTSAAENSKLGKNGSTNSTFITPGSWRAIQLGMSDTGQFYASELIFFYGDKSASRATIESNMNTYYSAY